VFGQRYEANGTPQGAEFRANTYTTGAQGDPAIAFDASGRFTVTWHGSGPGIARDNSIWARRYASNGAAFGPEFEVTSYAPTSGFTRNARITTLLSQGFVITWQGDGDGDGDGIFARRYNSSGVAQGPQFQVNTYTTGDQTEPVVAGGRDGSFVVVWQGPGPDGSFNAVAARRYNSTGVAQGAEFVVNSYTTGNQSRPWITGVNNHGFVVVWDGLGAANTLDVFARRLSISGTPYGSDARVNTYTTAFQSRPRIAAAADGSFLVAWQSDGQDGDDDGIHAQLYSRSTAGVGSEFQVNSHTLEFQAYVSAAAGGGGRGVFVWTSYAQDGNNSGIFGQRVLMDFIFGDGFD
jgi:hypothetical protein